MLQFLIVAYVLLSATKKEAALSTAREGLASLEKDFEELGVDSVVGQPDDYAYESGDYNYDYGELVTESPGQG